MHSSHLKIYGFNKRGDHVQHNKQRHKEMLTISFECSHFRLRTVQFTDHIGFLSDDALDELIPRKRDSLESGEEHAKATEQK